MNTPVTMLAAVVPSPKDEKKQGKRRTSMDQQLAATAAATSAIVPGDNYFDLLPDDLVCQILNRILDAKSLCQCLVLSKRFASLVPEVDSLSILATAPNLSSFYSTTTTAKKPSTKWTKNFLKKLVHHLIIKPLEFFQPISIELVRPETRPGGGDITNGNKNKIGPAEITQWISNSLKNFAGIQSLRLELPAGGGVVGFPDDVPLLRWSAEFGKELESCAIIAATSFEEKKTIVERSEQAQTEQKPSLPEDDRQQSNKDISDDNRENNNNISDNRENNNNNNISDNRENNNNNNSTTNSDQNQPLLSDADLKARVLWILSCLIAAGARHGLVRQMVLDCPNLKIAEIIDSGKQGKLSMNEDQIKTLRESIGSMTTTMTDSPPASPENNNNNSAADGNTTASSNPIWKRSAIPNLIMKLWYVPELELKGSGRVIKGATVVIVKPEGEIENGNNEDDVVSLGNGFCEDKDEGISEAAREIMKSKWRLMYKMQMNSF